MARSIASRASVWEACSDTVRYSPLSSRLTTMYTGVFPALDTTPVSKRSASWIAASSPFGSTCIAVLLEGAEEVVEPRHRRCYVAAVLSVGLFVFPAVLQLVQPFDEESGLIDHRLPSLRF